MARGIYDVAQRNMVVAMLNCGFGTRAIVQVTGVKRSSIRECMRRNLYNYEWSVADADRDDHLDLWVRGEYTEKLGRLHPNAVPRRAQIMLPWVEFKYCPSTTPR